ncbi:glycosyltransferase family 2 protein [Halorubrum sp. 48-1-W]|uniref:glycosyltransferase family 2 protein n=1 Tax=Halorubrum sp. 48-1-W TaxID=2249761 RepID=UPI000DCC2B46|nr:glycosyltransferase family 2 protein [Halorubrum sp. 48-1-W]RAW45645.1 glycosyltransferase family 2 protein [Halorubrum sp. 48-1-W]
MYDGHTVGVVVPAYNEAGHVGEVIETIPAYVDRVYAVDDASTDDTWAEIREHARRINASPVGSGVDGVEPVGPRADRSVVEVEVGTDGGVTPQVVPIQHGTNRGAGAAVKTGYAHALADDIDVIAVMDGDGQMDPDHLERIIEPVIAGDATYAKGNRLRSGRDYEQMSRWRLFGNGLLTFLTRVSSGYWDLSDPQNGFTAISNEGLRRIRFDRLYDQYGFLNHLLLALNINREPIADVSHPAKYADETSGIRYSRFVPTLSMLLARNFLERLVRSYFVRRFHPLIVCYVLGALALITGVAGGVYAVSTPAVDGFLGGMTSVTVGVLGGLLLTLGAWFDVSENEGLVRDVEQPTTDHADAGQRGRTLPGSIPEPIRDGGTIDPTDPDRR